MSFINFAAREINCKIVYYGAGLGGKTTNLQFIYQKTAEQQKGKMISLATETERTLFFDFLPLDLGSVRGFKTRIHLYTVPGQVFYDASRKLILRGVDGIVFVADSQEERMDANVEALDNLMSNLKEHGYDFNKIPYVLQLNKRDLPNVLPIDALSKQLRRKNEPVIEAVAFQGAGRLRNPERNCQAGADGFEAGRVERTSVLRSSDLRYYVAGLIADFHPSCIRRDYEPMSEVRRLSPRSEVPKSAARLPQPQRFQHPFKGRPQ